MFISNLDFLNSPPQLYFHEKKTNKTVLGGILFIIYILIMLTIVIFYLVDYYLHDKYEVRYSRYKYYNNQEEFIELNNEIYNNFNFSYNFYKITKDFDKIKLDTNFILADMDYNIIPMDMYNLSKIKDIIYYIMYICIGNCTLEDDKENLYSIELNYAGYKIDHRNEKMPLETNNINYTFSKRLFFTIDKTDIFEFNMEIIRYKEEKGLLGLFENWIDKKKEYRCIDIKSIEKSESNIILDNEIGEEGSQIVVKLLALIEFKKDKLEIEEYIRYKKSLLDIFANIGSLFSALLHIFTFIFNFYFEKNNNYTIIKELLSDPKIYINSNIKIPKAKTLKFENISKKNKNYLNFDKKSIDTSKSVPFKMENDNIINNKKIIKNNEEQNEQKDDIIYLKKLSLLDFLLDNFKCRKNKKKKSHIIIDICNKIMCKYTSVETILYNQIIFENLLKDYKWTDPSIKKISYNFLIRKLKLAT